MSEDDADRPDPDDADGQNGDDSTPADDPFAHIDRQAPDVDDRDEDPFEHIDGQAPPAEGAGPDSGGDPAAGEDPGAGPSEGVDTDAPGGTAEPETPYVDREASDAPLEDEPAPEGDPFAEGGAFDRAGVGGINPDRVWDEIADDESLADLSDESRYDDVDKHAFCERCEFFSAPPEVHCSHEGTEIVEFVDNDTVRLLNCPIVAEREALERD